jgi:ankyrin repeat protein
MDTSALSVCYSSTALPLTPIKVLAQLCPVVRNHIKSHPPQPFHDHHTDSNLDDQRVCASLRLASTNDHLTVAELLIQYGADVNSRDSQDSDSTPLHKAAQNGHLDVVTSLLKFGADPSSCDGNGLIALELARHNGKSDVARFLAEWMGVMESQDSPDMTRLDTAFQDPVPEVTQSSIARATGANGSHGGTSLYTASEAGDIETVRSLLEGGEDANKPDADDATPLLYASLSGRIGVVELLIEYGADVNSQDGSGWTPLHAAALSGHLDVVRVLLDHGADANAKRFDHWTALHLASSGDYFEVVEALLKHGANIDVRNDEGRTPSQVARRLGRRKIVELLSEYAVHRM